MFLLKLELDFASLYLNVTSIDLFLKQEWGFAVSYF